jgi:hypothetical protein
MTDDPTSQTVFSDDEMDVTYRYPIHRAHFESGPPVLTLHEDYVGLEEVDDGVYDLFYCFYHIGRYELKTNKIHDVVSKVGLSVRRVDHVSRVSPMSLE